MSQQAAGWYPDPEGDNQQRYWDGDSWTDYYSPLVTASAPTAPVHGEQSAAQDYPYLTTAHANAQPVATGAAGSGWPTVAPQTGHNGEFRGGDSRAKAVRWAIIVAVVLVVALVVSLVWLAVRLVSDDPAPTATGTAATATGTSDQNVVDGGAIGLEEMVTAELPEASIWSTELTLERDTTLQIDVRSLAFDADLLVTVLDSTGTEVAANDDRGPTLAGTSVNSLDPLVLTVLPAGTYTVRVQDRQSQEGDFELEAVPVARQLDLGTHQVEVPGDGYWIASFDVTADDAGTYEFAIDSSDSDGSPDSLIVLVAPSGRTYYNDDRNVDTRDSFLEQEMTEGTWFVIVVEYYSDPAEFDLEVSAR
ncbi:MAG: DUF2510 domain-containing protein [Beutenbergiaceae bacterium]